MNNENRKKISAETFFDEVTSFSKILALENEWNCLKENALKYLSASAEEKQTQKVKDYLSTDKFEEVIDETFNLLIDYAEKDFIPKNIMPVYNALYEFAHLDELKDYGEGQFQIRTSIAKSSCDLLIKNQEMDNELKRLVFYLDKNQTTFESGYYFYDFDVNRFGFITSKL